MGKTTIEWTATKRPDGTWAPGFTFNPWVGCTKVSAACDHCYAESWAKRSGHPELWAGDRRRTSAANWKQPLKWNADAAKAGVRACVFCASLADWADNQVPWEWRVDLFELIHQCQNLDWLLLSKRPQNAAKMIDQAMKGMRYPSTFPWSAKPWPNVWLGTTVENQEEADRRIPHLLAVPAKVHFLSCEPLLGPVDISLWTTPNRLLDRPAVNWVICGGESGGQARPMQDEWAIDLRHQCLAAGVSFFMKQMSGRKPEKELANFPEPLRVREFPNAA